MNSTAEYLEKMRRLTLWFKNYLEQHATLSIGLGAGILTAIIAFTKFCYVSYRAGVFEYLGVPREHLFFVQQEGIQFHVLYFVVAGIFFVALNFFGYYFYKHSIWQFIGFLFLYGLLCLAVVTAYVLITYGDAFLIEGMSLGRVAILIANISVLACFMSNIPVLMFILLSGLQRLPMRIRIRFFPHMKGFISRQTLNGDLRWSDVFKIMISIILIPIFCSGLGYVSAKKEKNFAIIDARELQNNVEVSTSHYAVLFYNADYLVAAPCDIIGEQLTIYKNYQIQVNKRRDVLTEDKHFELVQIDRGNVLKTQLRNPPPNASKTSPVVTEDDRKFGGRK